MVEVVYVVMDMNDGEPLWAFFSQDHADKYQIQVKDDYPETCVVEVNLG